jgi:DNA mismatch repair protein MutS
VARLAGLPAGVLARAREILANLESGELDAQGRPRLAGSGGGAADAGGQLGLFAAADGVGAELLEALRELDPERTTPLEALAWLARARARLREDEA